MSNRRLKLTPAEYKVWAAVQRRIGFYRHWPRWREYSGGFLFEEGPGLYWARYSGVTTENGPSRAAMGVNGFSTP
jgi:hypothetical protein